MKAMVVVSIHCGILFAGVISSSGEFIDGGQVLTGIISDYLHPGVLYM